MRRRGSGQRDSTRGPIRFHPTVELVNAPEVEKATGKAGQIAHRLMYGDRLIMDELGYLPFSQSGGALLFHLLSKLYEHTCVTTAELLMALPVLVQGQRACPAPPS